jgi:predicted O-methyltransferase YrrM
MLAYPLTIPAFASNAYRTAEQVGCGRDGGASSCKPGVGALLAVLAAAHPQGLIAELGSGMGAGTAWIVSGMHDEARLISVELDPGRSGLTQALLADDPRVTVLTGRWEELLPGRDPFDLVFVDCVEQAAIPDAWNRLLPLVRIGGQLVFDDVTPELEWSPAQRSHPDPKRDAVLRDPRVVGAELYPPDVDGRLGGPSSGLLLATRVR